MSRKNFILISLMIAGEAVFLLPFVLPRIFRPTFLTVLNLTNLELGYAYSVYGVIAMASYFLGGPIADRFSSKKLLIISLLLSSVAGVFLYDIPDFNGMMILYAFWGASTILLFWAAFIKTTRAYGGETQGLAFGMVDAGRGLFAAVLASGSIYLFSQLLPAEKTATTGDLTQALKSVILVFGIFGCISALLVSLALSGKKSESVESHGVTWSKLVDVMKRKSIWYQSLILLCAYAGYKCTDDFSLYAVEVLGFNDVEAAVVGSVSFWARAIGALGAGVLGDRFQRPRLLVICFSVMCISSLMLSIEFLSAIHVFTIVNLAVGSAAIYGLRGLYYSIFKESGIPLELTGTAVGLVSVVGYTPEIFMGPLMGVVLDGNPGPTGHYYLFSIVAVFGVGGIVATYFFNNETTRNKIDA